MHEDNDKLKHHFRHTPSEETTCLAITSRGRGSCLDFFLGSLLRWAERLLSALRAGTDRWGLEASEPEATFLQELLTPTRWGSAMKSTSGPGELLDFSPGQAKLTGVYPPKGREADLFQS